MAQRSKGSKPKALNKSALVAALVVFVSLSAAGARQIVSATNQQLDTVQRDLEATSALSAPSAGFENYLLVGSDSRDGADPSDPDFATMGNEGDVSGRRSDTLMVFHYDYATGAEHCCRFRAIFGCVLATVKTRRASILHIKRAPMCWCARCKAISISQFIII